MLLFGKFPSQHSADFFVEGDDEHIFPHVVQWNIAMLEKLLIFEGIYIFFSQNHLGEFVSLKDNLSPKMAQHFIGIWGEVEIFSHLLRTDVVTKA